LRNEANSLEPLFLPTPKNGRQAADQANKKVDDALNKVYQVAPSSPNAPAPGQSTASAGQGTASAQDGSVNPYATTPPTRAPAASPTPAAPTLVKGADGRQYLPGAVTQEDLDKSELLLNSVRGKWGANSPNKESRQDALNTVNEAWALRGSGIKATMDPRGNGQLVFSNSTAPEKMAYVDASGAPTTDYTKTSQYAQGVDTAKRMSALADKMEGERKVQESEWAAARREQQIMTAGPSSYDIEKAKWELSVASSGGKYADQNKIKAAQANFNAVMQAKQAADAARSSYVNQSQQAQAQMAQTNALANRQKSADDLARQQFGLTQQEFDMKKAQQNKIDALRQSYADAKTPAEKQAIKNIMIELGLIKTTESTYHPGTKVIDALGNQTITDGTVFNPNTQEVRFVGNNGQQGQAATPDAATVRAQALAALQANPANKDEINKRLVANGYQPI